LKIDFEMVEMPRRGVELAS